MYTCESRRDRSTNPETRVLWGCWPPWEHSITAASQQRWKRFHLFRFRSWSRHNWYHLAVGDQFSEENTGGVTFTVLVEANFSSVNSTVRCRCRSVHCVCEIAAKRSSSYTASSARRFRFVEASSWKYNCAAKHYIKLPKLWSVFVGWAKKNLFTLFLNAFTGW